MIDWFFETGLYLLAVALIPAAGLVLVCFGLWGDRSKGRPRCPKCWYDMRGSLPRLECPECGHAPGRERGLYGNRRGRRRIVVGVVFVLLSAYPVTIAIGWCRDQAAISRLVQLRTHESRDGASVSSPVWHGGPSGVNVAPTGPEWLMARLPEGFARLFDRATFVNFDGPATDRHLAECGKLRHLRTLYAMGEQITDRGLEHLKGLAQLGYVRLWDTQVTEVAVAGLRRALPNADIATVLDDSIRTYIPDARPHWPPPGMP